MTESNRQSKDVYSWFRENQESSCLKVLAGIRGAGKSFALEKIRQELTSSGAAVISFDFEATENRKVRTCAQVLKLFALDSKPGVKHVFLDEVGFFSECRELLRVLRADADCRVLVATSNERVLQPDCLGEIPEDMTRYDLLPDPKRLRSALELDCLWNKVLVRDVLGGDVLANAYIEARIAEYYADHLGQFVSSRRIVADALMKGRKIVHATMGRYMQLLEKAFLVERVPQWDHFGGSASTRCFAYYFTDNELREHCFGTTGPEADERVALNAGYLALRRTFGRNVYVTGRGDLQADFVTVEGTVVRLWRADRQTHGLCSEVENGTK